MSEDEFDDVIDEEIDAIELLKEELRKRGLDFNEFDAELQSDFSYAVYDKNKKFLGEIQLFYSEPLQGELVSKDELRKQAAAIASAALKEGKKQ